MPSPHYTPSLIHSSEGDGSYQFAFKPHPVECFIAVRQKRKSGNKGGVRKGGTATVSQCRCGGYRAQSPELSGWFFSQGDGRDMLSPSTWAEALLACPKGRSRKNGCWVPFPFSFVACLRLIKNTFWQFGFISLSTTLQIECKFKS